MKTMWCSEGGVSMVAVREESGVLLACEATDECWWEATPGTLHETETEARRAWLRAQETAYENSLDRTQGEIAELRKEERRIALLLQAAWRERDGAIDSLAAVRAQLAELDAVEGRR